MFHHTTNKNTITIHSKMNLIPESFYQNENEKAFLEESLFILKELINKFGLGLTYLEACYDRSHPRDIGIIFNDFTGMVTFSSSKEPVFFLECFHADRKKLSKDKLILIINRNDFESIVRGLELRDPVNPHHRAKC